MTDIHRSLRALAGEIDFPPTPDLLSRVALEPHRPRHRLRRRTIALALAALAVAVATGLALSPGARSAFRQLFRIGSVQVVRLDEAPAAVAAQLVPFGRPVSFELAARSVPFRLRLPETDVAPRPARVYLDRAGGGIVSLVWCCPRRVVLTELQNATPGVIQKTVGPATLVEPVQVRGESGLWVVGSDHVVRVVTVTGSWTERPVLVEGGVLIWTSQGVTLRLEGNLSKDEALAIAKRIR
jgi:hypothetical protein